MTERQGSLIRHASVPIEAAAELVGVDVSAVRGWASRGSVLIEQRGDMEVVQLDQVRALASRERASRRGVLRDRLRQAEAMAPSIDLVNIADLQEVVRGRAG